MILLIYLLIANVVAYIMMADDKRRAQLRMRRIPEKKLFLAAALGGALGSWLGMRSFRHKTKHATFTIGIPALFVLNAICVCFILQLMY